MEHPAIASTLNFKVKCFSQVGVATPEMATFSVFTMAALIALPVAARIADTFVATAASCVTLSLAEPVTAFGLAIVVVGECPDAFAFGGLILVVAGLLLVVWVETRQKGGL